jgi:hypothetical protein
MVVLRVRSIQKALSCSSLQAASANAHLGVTHACFASQWGSQELEPLRRRVAAERTVTQATEQNPISIS